MRRAFGAGAIQLGYWVPRPGSVPLIGPTRSNILRSVGKMVDRVHRCAATGGFDDDRHATWKWSYEIVLWRANERGPPGFARRGESSGDGSKQAGSADRHRILIRRRKNGRRRGQR